MQQRQSAFQQTSASESPDMSPSSVNIPDNTSLSPHPDSVRCDVQRAVQQSYNTEDDKFKGHQHDNCESHVRHFHRILNCYFVTSTDKLDLFQLTFGGVVLLRCEKLLRLCQLCDQTAPHVASQFNSIENKRQSVSS